MGRTKRKVSKRAPRHRKLVKKGRKTRVRARAGVRYGAKIRRKAGKAKRAK